MKMKNNDFNKDNIVSLDQKRKQRLEEEVIEQEMDNSSEVMDKMIDLLFANMDDTMKNELKGMIGSYGMRKSLKLKKCLILMNYRK